MQNDNKENMSKSNDSVSTNLYNPVLTEKDFYPPEDDRYLTSGVEDIRHGDNFVEYVEYYFATYVEED